MKMLGQDLLTQEEFDTFKMNEFDPLVKQVSRLKNWMIGLSVTSGISIMGIILLALK